MVREKLIRPGDWLVLALAACAVLVLAEHLWLSGGGGARSVIVRSAGGIVQELPLATNARYRVQGPLGTSEVEVRDRRVRIARDPSPKQYCVKQGWLTRAGQVALCLPNQVSIQIAGGSAYDSLNF
jgi:hypothetical protein